MGCASFPLNRWKYIYQRFSAFLSPCSSHRSRLLSDCPFNRVLLDPAECQALWHIPRPGFSQGRGTGKGHVGGGRVHLQLQRLPDDPQVSYSDNYCTTGAIWALAQAVFHLPSWSTTSSYTDKLDIACMLHRCSNSPACPGATLCSTSLMWNKNHTGLASLFQNSNVEVQKSLRLIMFKTFRRKS